MSKRLSKSGIFFKAITGLLIMGIIVVIAVAVILFTRSAYTIGYAVFNPTPFDKNETKVEVTIPKGAGNRAVADILLKKGLVHNKMVTYLQLKLSKYNKKIEPGTYTLNTSMTPDELFSSMSKTTETDKKKEKP